MSPEPPHILVIGCGNLLRADDGVGPVMIRHLLDRDLPADVEVADGGTAGMDVAFRIRGAGHVILVDACVSGGEPGTIYELPASEAETPPLEAAGNLHSFRWDHAITFARWLLKDEFPTTVTAFLIEAESTAPGMELSDTVAASMHRLIDLLMERWAAGGTGADPAREADPWPASEGSQPCASN
jgi:hydrogenase maturation protease